MLHVSRMVLLQIADPKVAINKVNSLKIGTIRVVLLHSPSQSMETLDSLLWLNRNVLICIEYIVATVLQSIYY
jgi:hypothetical protein